jgi:hypothetical protein
MQKDDESFRSPLPIRNRRRIATEAVLPGGELAGGGSENGYAALVAPISGWRKVFCDGSKADSAKVFVPEGKMWQINFEPMVFINSGTGRIPSPKRK